MTHATISCTKRLEFDTGHRIHNDTSGCQMLHGHRYALEVSFISKTLNASGMILNFKIIKDSLKKWLDENWDHNFILSEDDKALGDFISKYTGQKIFFLDVPPTVENLALFLFYEVCPKLFDQHDVVCHKLKLYETPNSFAEVFA